MTDIRTLLSKANRQLGMAGVEGSLRDARLLLQAASDVPVATQIAYPERTIEENAIALFQGFVARRAERQPMAHILGGREFWSLDFLVTPHTLDPRPDSETLVQAVLERTRNRAAPLRLLDFGTGTGCLLLALLHELPHATGIGIDISPEALEVASENARNLGLAGRVQFCLRNWDRGLVPAFDIILSNPPYIPSDVIDTLQPEVSRFEPRIALDGGADGLDAYRRLAPAAARLLAPDGLAAFEIGLGQIESVVAIGGAAGLRHIATATDLGAVQRCVLFRK